MDKEIREFTEAIGAVTPPSGNKYDLIFKSIPKRANYFLLYDKFPLMVKSLNP